MVIKEKDIKMNIDQIQYPWLIEECFGVACVNPVCRHCNLDEIHPFTLAEFGLGKDGRCPMKHQCPDSAGCGLFHPLSEVQYNHQQTFARYISQPYIQFYKNKLDMGYLWDKIDDLELVDWKEECHLGQTLETVISVFAGDQIIQAVNTATQAVAEVKGEGVSTVMITGTREAVRAVVGDFRAEQVEELLTMLSGMMQEEIQGQAISGKYGKVMVKGIRALGTGKTVEESVEMAMEDN